MIELCGDFTSELCFPYSLLPSSTEVLIYVLKCVLTSEHLESTLYMGGPGKHGVVKDLEASYNDITIRSFSVPLGSTRTNRITSRILWSFLVPWSRAHDSDSEAVRVPRWRILAHDSPAERPMPPTCSRVRVSGEVLSNVQCSFIHCS